MQVFGEDFFILYNKLNKLGVQMKKRTDFIVNGVLQIALNILPEGKTAAPEPVGYLALRDPSPQGFPDEGVVPEKRSGFLAGTAAFRPTERSAFGFHTGEGFACPLADQVPLNLRGQTESERQHLGLYVFPQPVAVFDGPYHTAATHAIAQDFHNHIEAPAQPAQLTADNQIPLPRMPQQLA